MPTDPVQVLIVDDEPPIGELLGEMLNLVGYGTTICVSGPEALKLMARREFDAIISDYWMPGMTGQQFYEHLQAAFPSMAERVVFLTGDLLTQRTQFFLRSVGQPQITKPFQLAQVEQAVSQIVLRKWLRREAPAENVSA